MLKIIDVTAAPGGDSRLILSENEAFLADVGFPFSGAATLANVKAALDGRTVDYILITHAHYDHVGALPLFKKAFPDAVVVECAATNSILERPGARKFIADMDMNAAGESGRGFDVGSYTGDYDFPAADLIVADGDIIQARDATIEVLETPGHTRDSVMYFFREDGLLISNETTGVLLQGGQVHASFVTSYLQALEAIDRAEKLGAKTIILPHGSIIDGEQAAGYFARSRESATNKAETILKCHDAGMSEDEIVEEVKRKFFFTRTPEDRAMQPEKAFEVNQRATIPKLLAELRPQEQA